MRTFGSWKISNGSLAGLVLHLFRVFCGFFGEEKTMVINKFKKVDPTLSMSKQEETPPFLEGKTMTSQTQKSGDDSVNIQGRDITIGLSYTEARQIAQDVFDSNFFRLSGVAQETAKQRADALLEEYLNRISTDAPQKLEASKDPDMQYAIFSAQKAYARTGDDSLSDILVDILVHRASQQERNLLQIVLNESLEVAPKLTPQHFDILSLVFIMRYTKCLKLRSLQDMHQYLGKMFEAFSAGLSESNSNFQHLEYAGCGAIQVTEIKIEELFRNQYPGLFWKGISNEEVESLITSGTAYRDMFIPCLHDPTLFQLNALDNENLEQACKTRGMAEDAITRCKDFQKNHLMGHDDIRNHLATFVPSSSHVLDTWSSTPMKNFTLTSVGIAIAHANIRRRLPDEHFDLTIWIK